MACDRMRELAFLSVDGELTEAERSELAAHLAGCAGCRAAQAAAARVASGVRQLAPPPVPLGFAERTLNRLDSPPTSAVVRALPRPFKLLVPIAAVAATLVAATVFLAELRRKAEPRGESIASAQKPESEPEPEPAALPEERRSAGRIADAPAPESAAADHAGLFDAAERGKSAGDGVGRSNELEAALAAGTTSDALHRVDELVAKAGEQDAILGGLEKSAIESKDDDAGAAKKRVQEASDREADRRAENEEFSRKDDLDRLKLEATPALRFLRVTGDAKGLAALLANDATRDGAGRYVVELGEEEAKSLRARLASAGLKSEELAAADWLRAAQPAAKVEGQVAAAPAAKSSDKEKGAPIAAPTTVPTNKPDAATARGAGTKKVGAPAKAGDGKAGAAAPPAAAGEAGFAAPAPKPRRERWFILVRPG